MGNLGSYRALHRLYTVFSANLLAGLHSLHVSIWLLSVNVFTTLIVSQLLPELRHIS
jgi:hypothetical protein